MFNVVFYCNKEHRNEVKVKTYAELNSSCCSECGRRMERFEHVDPKTGRDGH